MLLQSYSSDEGKRTVIYLKLKVKIIFKIPIKMDLLPLFEASPINTHGITHGL